MLGKKRMQKKMHFKEKETDLSFIRERKKENVANLVRKFRDLFFNE